MYDSISGELQVVFCSRITFHMWGNRTRISQTPKVYKVMTTRISFVVRRATSHSVFVRCQFFRSIASKSLKTGSSRSIIYMTTSTTTKEVWWKVPSVHSFAAVSHHMYPELEFLFKILTIICSTVLCMSRTLRPKATLR